MTESSGRWRVFASQVEDHITTYVVPQYGDAPGDPASQYDIATIKAQIEKYTARIGRNARGREEALRDCLKLAHYAQMLHRRISDG